MDGARQHFLAGAGGAVDEHGDVRLRDTLRQGEQRQRFGVGRGRHVGTGDERAGEAVADRRIGGTERDPRRIAVARGDDMAALVTDDDGAGGCRRRLALGDQEQVGRAGLTRFEGPHAESLGAKPRHERVFALRHRSGRKDRTHLVSPKDILQMRQEG